MNKNNLDGDFTLEWKEEFRMESGEWKLIGEFCFENIKSFSDVNKIKEEWNHIIFKRNVDG